ncbi:MAG: IS110 family transposase [Actinomycetota bacterium]|nr:IS110 family transposase [Actinomycetota bacterium]
MNVWVGLDVGKSDHHGDVIDDDGNALFDRRVHNDEADLDALFDRAGGYGTVGLVIDQPGSIAQLAIAVAARRQIPVAYVPGLVMRRAADLYPGEAKTDRRDAAVLADVGRRWRNQIHWLDLDTADELLAQLRVLNGYDVDLAADANRVSNRLRDSLTSISPALERALGAQLRHAGVRDLLCRYPTPTALAKAGRARIVKTIKRRSPRLADKTATAVLDALAAQTVTLPAEAAVGQIISELAAELDRIHERRDSLESQIEAAFTAHPFGRLLLTMPGIGPRTGARILAEIGDGSRFSSGSKLASYAGIAPVVRQSGTSLRGETKSRKGNHRLKNAMFIAAFASLSAPESRAFYDRKRAEGKRHNAAVICLARRRCNVIFAMLRNQQPYQPPQPNPLPKAA